MAATNESHKSDVSFVRPTVLQVEHTPLGLLQLQSFLAVHSLVLPRVSEVVVNFCELTDDVIALSGLLPHAFRIGVTKVELLQNHLGPLTCQLISTYLPHCSVQRLKLGGNPLGDQGAIALAKGLKLNQSLVQLNLNGCQIGDKGIIALCSALVGKSTLTSLCLRNNAFGLTGMQALCILLIHDGCRVTDLSLRHNEKLLSNGGSSNDAAHHPQHLLSHLCTAVMFGHSLRVLELEAVGLTADEVAPLCVALSNNGTVQQLNVSHNALGDSGASAIARLLRVNSTLDTVAAHTAQISTQGGVLVAESLRLNATLTALNLGSNQLKDYGCCSFAVTLQSNTTLQRLDLRSNGIGLPGVASLASVVRKTSSLKSLDVSGNHVGDLGAQQWAKVLCHNTTLTELSLANSHMSILGVQTLLDVLPHNVSLLSFCLGLMPKSFISRIRKVTARNRELLEQPPNELLFSGVDDITTAVYSVDNDNNKSVMAPFPSGRRNSNSNSNSNLKSNSKSTPPTLSEACITREATQYTEPAEWEVPTIQGLEETLPSLVAGNEGMASVAKFGIQELNTAGGSVSLPWRDQHRLSEVNPTTTSVSVSSLPTTKDVTA